MNRPALPFILALCLAACSSGMSDPSPVATDPALASMASIPSPSAKATAPAASARKVSESTDLIEFEYAYPDQAAAIPGLKAWLDADLASRRSAVTSEAREARREMVEAGIEYRPYGYWAAWQVVTELPDWLSLSANVGTYQGGAHPNHTFGAILWDKAAGTRREPLDLFVSPAALSAAIRRDFCAALDKQRREKRGGETLDGSFEECVDPVASTIILGSSTRQGFDRIGVLVPPYEAGPYAEGSYEVTLPVTRAVLDTVRPEYRKAFALKR